MTFYLRFDGKKLKLSVLYMSVLSAILGRTCLHFLNFRSAGNFRDNCAGGEKNVRIVTI